MAVRKQSTSAIAKRLYGAAAKRAQARGFKFGEGSDADLQNFAGEAAKKLADTAGAAAIPEGMLRASEVAFERVVDEMIDAAHEIRGYLDTRGRVIGERTLARALKRLCPLWPIC